MTIKRIFIPKIYPLNDDFVMEPKDFNLIYGPKNESGKTLIFDILTFLLFKKDIFKHGRLREMASILKDRGEVEIKIGKKTVIFKGDQEILQKRYGFSDEAIANIFCCRASEFALLEQQQPREKNRWWSYVKESFSNFSDINKISDRVKSNSYLTPTLQLQEGIKKEKERLQEKAGIIEDLLQSEVYKEIREYERLGRKFLNLNKEKDLLEVAGAKKKYDDASLLLKDVKEKNEILEEGFGGIDEEGLRELEGFEADIRNHSGAVKTLTADIGKTKGIIEKLMKKREKAEKETEHYEKFDYESFLDDLKRLRDTEQAIEGESILAKNKWLVPLSTGVALLALILERIEIAVLLLLPLLGKLYGDKRKKTLESGLKRDLRNFKVELASFIEVPKRFTDSSEVEVSLNKIKEAKRKAHDAFISINEQLKNSRKIEGEEGGKLEVAERKLDARKKKYAEFLQEKDCKTKEELESKIIQKRKLQKKIDKTQSQISGILSEGDKEQWRKRLKELEEKARKLPESEIPEFNENRLKEVLEKIKEKGEKKKEMSGRIEEYKTQIHQLGVKTLDELVELKEGTHQRINEIATASESGRIAVKILKRLLDTQEDFLESIFTDKKVSISKTFKELTGGRYQRVYLEGNNIRLITRKGRKLNSNILRGSGVSDQLYLSIRFALAESILKGKGFLILDEPFLRFDKVERLEKGFDLLFQMVKMGWQVFYFTFEPRVFDLVKNKYSRENIQIEELKQLQI